MKVRLLSAMLAALVAAPAAAQVQYGANGHYYEFVSRGVSYDDALAAAAASSYLGLQGYLATVTSQGEQDFIYNSVTSSGTWFSGSDRANEGTWIWEAGPEAGQVFWLGGPGGSSPIYANWSGGEPNNAGNENFLWGNWSGSAWNDIGNASLGYVIEYGGLEQNGGVPEPATWAMMVAGFGMVGGALRSRRRAIAPA